MELGLGCMVGIISYCLDFCRGWVDAFFSNDMSKEIHFFGCNCAFLWLEVEFPEVKMAKDFLEQLHMLFERFGVDHDIINVDVESFSNHVGEYFIHSTLKCGGGIAESKGHSGVFIMTIRGHKGRLF